MKTRFLNKMAALLAVLLLFSCTGKFEEYNTDNTGFTDEQKTYDYNTFGVWLKVVQMGIYFNYDWGSGKNWHFQTMQNLNADMFSGYMHDFKPFNAGLGNTVYNLQDGWNGTMWDNTYGYIMTEIKQTEDHSRDKYPAFYAIAKILKVEIMHRISDYYGPIVYTKFGESDAGVMPDSQKDAYYAFFQDLGEAIHLLSEYDGEETFSRFDMIMPENYRTFGEWMRFANSLRLRLAIRIAMADPDKARDEAHKSLTHPAGLLEEAYEVGTLKAIGVSNFYPHVLANFCETVRIKPMVNQVELHPYFAQPAALETMKHYHVQPEAWAPLGGGRHHPYEDEMLQGIADAHQKTIAQVILRWNVQRGVTVIPKSTRQERIEENFAIWDFSLTTSEMAQIGALDLGYVGEAVKHFNPEFVRGCLGVKIHD